MLQTQGLGQDERHCHQPPQGREEVLWAEQREEADLEMLWLPTPPNPIPPTGGSTSGPRGDPGKWQELGRPGSEKQGHNQKVWASKAGPQG